jgi:hypothetical protein
MRRVREEKEDAMVDAVRVPSVGHGGARSEEVGQNSHAFDAGLPGSFTRTGNNPGKNWKGGSKTLKCQYCGEGMEAGDAAPLSSSNMHLECFVRAVFGSAAHQLGECSCYGGTREDPPGLSVRAAAKLAHDTFRMLAGEDV